MKKITTTILLLLIAIVACSPPPAPNEDGVILDPVQEELVVVSPSSLPPPTAPPPAVTAAPESSPEDVIAGPTAAVEAAIEPPTVTPEPAIVPINPIEVTYFTPSQQEGPYYPVEKLADQDNDLTVLIGADGSAAGTRLDLSGTVYDAAGVPLEGITLEIWQTDSSGAYMHPNDPATDGRDRNFQFYGEAVTDATGRYRFLTIVPGKYEPRPVHIHVKVRAGEQYLLTTQFYFANDPTLAGSGIDRGNGVHMIVALTEGVDDAGREMMIGIRDVILAAELPDYYPAGLD